MIKAIIFDFGNVICKFDNTLFIKKISKYTDKSQKEITNLIYNNSNLPVLYESGLISSDEFSWRITKLCALRISKEDFIKIYTNKFTPIESTFELIRKLKRNYKIALLSNTSKADFDLGVKPLNIFPLFDAITLSFEVKAMKPDSRIFEDMLKKLDLKPEECIYIDDLKEYSDKAKELGMFGINYTSSEKLLESLKFLDVKI
jgi:glucose-1-phosphatase